MRKYSDKDMERLVQLFMEGMTSLEQECRLYAYFSGPDVAPALECYRDMFAGFAAIGQAEGKKRRVVSLRRWCVWAAAACVLFAVFYVAADKYEEWHLESLYGGSYMIVNGERIDDLQAMKPEIERILAYTEKLEQRTSISNCLQSIEVNIIE
jgi:hypothetical protein